MTYLSRDDLLARLKRREADYPLPDGGLIRYREPMARDILEAEAAGEPHPETGVFAHSARYWALLVQRNVLDGPGGQPLFTSDDISDLAEARWPLWQPNLLRSLSDAIVALGEARPDDLKSVGGALDGVGDADPDVRPSDAGGDDRDDGPGTGSSGDDLPQPDGTGDGPRQDG